jgi:hypothetical protein
VTGPTIPQLRNLTDRASDGLTPDEQQRLRDGIDRLELAEAALARVQALADEYPAGIDTALIHEALDQTRPAATQATEHAHNDGPSVREAADNDRRWPLQKAGE